ncbi:MAG: AraC family transcriptional regulator [Janthinobacterium lividum]
MTSRGAGATASTGGILRPEEFARHVDLRRLPPAADLAPWVENHWVLRWDLPEGVTSKSQVLPHPTCNLTVERGVRRPDAPPAAVLVTGPATRRFDVETTGRGWVWGVRFRPGGLPALAGLDAIHLAERTVAASDLLPGGVVAALDALHDTGSPAEADQARVEAALRPLVGDPDPDHELVLALVSEMLADRTLVRVAQVSERHGLPTRRLQRLFSRYVGVGPKWVLARYRMHDVVAALDGGHDGSLAALAVEHGWYDQAHFTRDFTALVGVTPARYRARSGA